MQHVFIIGFGLTGKALLKYYQSQGCYVTIFDDKISKLDNYYSIIEKVDLVVFTPGVKESHLLIAYAKKLGKKILPSLDAEFLEYKKIITDQKIVGVTGTNGKTTTTLLLSKILSNSYIAGNVGMPWMDAFDFSKKVAVLELSSFQLKNIKFFSPNIAVLLNIKPDHLDWHSSEDDYVNSKFKILQNINKTDFVVANYDDLIIREQVLKTKCKKFFFGFSNQHEGLFCDFVSIYLKNRNSKIKLLDCVDIPLIGKHNLQNVMSAICVALILGESVTDIKKRISQFVAPEFRLQEIDCQFVRNNEIKVINDSKSTNLASTLTALDCFAKNVILFVGGIDKNENLNLLFSKENKNKLKAVITFGKSKDKFFAVAKNNGYKNITKFENIYEATDYAKEIAKKGDVVLFSPACASFDQFSSYIERGNVFNELISKDTKTNAT